VRKILKSGGGGNALDEMKGLWGPLHKGEKLGLLMAGHGGERLGGGA